MLLIKVGGGEAINLKGVVEDMAELKEPAIVVHGANALRDELANRLGMDKKVITSQSGYSSVLSDKDAIDVILMAYSGLRNKRLVEMFQQQGVNAVGLTGLDGRLVQGERNRGIRVREGGKNLMKRDFSGKPRTVNAELLKLLLDHGYTPVLTIPIVDERGFAINSENDDVINIIQQAVKADRIVQLIEAVGFLNDAGDPDSVVKNLSRNELAQREAGLEGRMKRKMLALSRLCQDQTVTVYISDGRTQTPLRDALAGAGTVIR